jgi:hypothetical protein
MIINSQKSEGGGSISPESCRFGSSGYASNISASHGSSSSPRAGIDIGVNPIPKHNGALHWSGAFLRHATAAKSLIFIRSRGPEGFDRRRE